MLLSLIYMLNQLKNKNMRKINLIFICLVLFLTIPNFAQNGMNRSNQEMDEINQKNQRAEFEKTKNQNIEKTISGLKKDLELDALQEIAIKQLLNENIAAQGIIVKKEENQEEKIKALKSLSESTDTKIMALLNKSQKEKYINFKENKKKKK